MSHEDYDPGKPHPACYLAAAREAGLPPEQCVVFEDSNAGVCAAKDAGAYAVALARPDRPEQDYSRADLVLEDLSLFEPSMLNRYGERKGLKRLDGVDPVRPGDPS